MADNIESDNLTHSAIITVDNLEELYKLDVKDLIPGDIAFVISEYAFYIYTGDIKNLWITFEGYDFGTYTNLEPVPENVGGIEKGTTFLEVPYKNLFDMLLYPFQHPYFNLFTVNGTTKLSLELGQTLNSPLTYSWGMYNSHNADLSTLKLELGNEEIILDDSEKKVSNVVVKDIAPITKDEVYKIIATISCVDAKEKMVSSSVDIKWQHAIYNGVSKNGEITPEEISLFSYKLADNFLGTYEFEQGGGYQYVIYPSEWGIPKKILDENDFNFAIDDIKTINVENKYGVIVECNIIRSKNFLHSPAKLIIKN